MSEIRAIETSYKGHLFRSRLEARWAVFFDAQGIDWKYENQGYERVVDGKTLRYLPDFEITNGERKFFVEVKGDSDYFKKTAQLQIDLHSGKGCLPGFDAPRDSSNGLIILGQVPDAESMLRKDQHPAHAVFRIDEAGFLQKSYGIFIGKGFVVCTGYLLAAILGVFPESLSSPDSDWSFDVKPLPTGHFNFRTSKAYSAARSARFEHGQSGAA